MANLHCTYQYYIMFRRVFLFYLNGKIYIVLKKLLFDMPFDILVLSTYIILGIFHCILLSHITY